MSDVPNLTWEGHHNALNLVTAEAVRQREEMEAARRNDLEIHRQQIAELERQLEAAGTLAEELRTEIDNAWSALTGIGGAFQRDGQPVDIPETTLADEIGILLSERDQLRARNAELEAALAENQ